MWTWKYQHYTNQSLFKFPQCKRTIKTLLIVSPVISSLCTYSLTLSYLSQNFPRHLYGISAAKWREILLVQMSSCENSRSTISIKWLLYSRREESYCICRSLHLGNHNFNNRLLYLLTVLCVFSFAQINGNETERRNKFCSQNKSDFDNHSWYLLKLETAKNDNVPQDSHFFELALPKQYLGQMHRKMQAQIEIRATARIREDIKQEPCSPFNQSQEGAFGLLRRKLFRVGECPIFADEVDSN